MPAIVAAAVTPTQMIFRGENQSSVWIKVEIAGKIFRIRSGRISGAMKNRDARVADARAVFQILRHPRQQFFRNLYSRAPARAFVCIHGAELAMIVRAAQRTFSRIQCGIVGIHSRS
jgi:hypothetical protein